MPYRLQILFGVYAAGRSVLGDEHADFVPVIQRAQLLQRLKMLDGCWSQLSVGAQETGAVCVDADVAQYGQVFR